jgi:hypothetical protein
MWHFQVIKKQEHFYIHKEIRLVVELGGPVGALPPPPYAWYIKAFFRQNIDQNWILGENYPYWPPLSEN